MVQSFSTQSILSAQSSSGRLSTRYSIPWITIGLSLLLWLAPRVYGAVPTFEHGTPVGFSTVDSTTQHEVLLRRAGRADHGAR